MKKTLLMTGCLAVGLWTAQAQELQERYWVSDFENDEALYWNSIASARLEVVDNPFKDEVNGSDKVLKMTLPKGELYAGAIITVDGLPVGDVGGHYRYGRVKMYKPEAGTSILKLQKGPNDLQREISKTIEGGAWVDASFDFNFTASGDAGAVGEYGEVFVIGNTTEYETEEFVMYIDDILFTNEEQIVDDGLPAPTDELAILDNFENGKVNFADALNPMEGASFSVVDNPKKDAVNGSNKVLEVVRPEGKPAWVGFFAKLNANAVPKCDMDKYRYARMKLLQDVACDSASFKVEVPQGKFVEKKSKTDKVDEWEEVIFDMEVAEGLYPVIAIMPDYAEGRPAHSVYIDDIIFSATIDGEEPGSSVEMQTVANSLRTVVEGNHVSVMFRAETEEEMTLSIYDTTGRMIAAQAVNAVSGDNSVSLHIEATGVLLVKVSTGNKAVVSKFYK